jgi:putative ABC transport system permease protein
MFFHYKYLSEKGMGGFEAVGTYILELNDPSQAGAITQVVDSQFENAAPATLTETEQAFQAGFVSMYGNIPFVLRVIGLAIVFSILLIAANTMMTSIRERTSEFGVLKTLGFTDGAVFGIVVIEAAIITLGGGLLGALGAKLVVSGASVPGGFFPPMSVYWGTVLSGVAIAVVIGAVSGLLPAMQASRLRIVDALRRVE